MSATGFLKVQ